MYFRATIFPMFGFVSSLLTFITAEAEEHPDIAKTLADDVVGTVKKWLGHSDPQSVEATQALNAGIAAASSSAVTSVLARTLKT